MLAAARADRSGPGNEARRRAQELARLRQAETGGGRELEAGAGRAPVGGRRVRGERSRGGGSPHIEADSQRRRSAARGRRHRERCEAAVALYSAAGTAAVVA